MLIEFLIVNSREKIACRSLEAKLKMFRIPVNTIQVYNPEQDIWSPVPDMFARRSGAGVGVLHGLLYRYRILLAAW